MTRRKGKVRKPNPLYCGDVRIANVWPDIQPSTSERRVSVGTGGWDGRGLGADDTARLIAWLQRALAWQRKGRR